MEILQDILTVALKGATKTQIVYQANLNFPLLKRKLSYLLKREFIEAGSNNPTYYRTTEKGKVLLKRLNKVLEMLS